MNRTGIEYLDFTSNPIIGCDMTLPCAERCWARRMARRLKAAGVPHYQTVTSIHGGWTGKTAFVEYELQALLRRRKPATVGLCFMGDAFHESVPDEWLDRMFAVCALTPHLRYLILTKRAKRMREWSRQRFLPDTVFPRGVGLNRQELLRCCWPLPNVGLGVSVEDRANKVRIDELRQTPAAMRFLSLEPLLEDLGVLDLTGISWIIVGGESGPGARPMHPDWVRSVRDQCVAAGVPFLFKQWGRNIPVGQHDPDQNGRLLDGKLWDQRPEMLK